MALKGLCVCLDIMAILALAFVHGSADSPGTRRERPPVVGAHVPTLVGGHAH